MKILCVDDFVEVRASLGRFLRRFGVEFLEAGTLAEARQIIGENPDLGFIIFDGCLDPNNQTGDEPDTAPLVRELKSDGCPARLIACSSEAKLNAALLVAGCERAFGKTDLSPWLLKQNQ